MKGEPVDVPPKARKAQTIGRLVFFGVILVAVVLILWLLF